MFLWVSAAFVLAIVGFNLGGLLLLARGGCTPPRDGSCGVALGASRGRTSASQLLTECLGLVSAGSLLGAVAAWGFIHLLSARSSVQIPLLRPPAPGRQHPWATPSSFVLPRRLFVASRLPWKFLRREADGESAERGVPRFVKRSRPLLRAKCPGRGRGCTSILAGGFRDAHGHELEKPPQGRFLGFRPAGLVAIRIDPVTQGTQSDYIENALDRVRALPGVECAAVTDSIPVERDRSWGLYPVVPGRPAEQHRQGAGTCGHCEPRAHSHHGDADPLLAATSREATQRDRRPS